MAGEMAVIGDRFDNGAQTTAADGKRHDGGGKDQSCRQLRWRSRGPVAMLGDDHRSQPIAKESRVADDGVIAGPERRR